MDNMMLWITLVCNVLIVFAFAVTPFVTRKTELFGVSLPSSEIKRFELSEMRRAYLRAVLMSGAALIAVNIILFLIISHEMAQTRIYLILIFAYVAVAFMIYLVFHKKMVAFKAAQPWRAHGAAANAGRAFGREAAESPETVASPEAATSSGIAESAEPVLVVDTSPPGREVVRPAWLWLFAAIGGGTLLYLWKIWPSLPDRIPMNMDTSGVVVEFMGKGPGAFFTMMLAQWIIIGVFIMVYFMIPAAKRQIDAANPEVSREQGRRFRYRMSACMVFCGAALAAIVGILPVAMAQSDGGMAFVVGPLVATMAVVVVMLVVMFRAGQGGSKLDVGTVEPSAEYKRMANTDDDKYWKLGVFYFNPKDPAFLVEKRFGIGWTVNFGKPAGLLLIVGIIAVVVVALVIGYSSV